MLSCLDGEDADVLIGRGERRAEEERPVYTRFGILSKRALRRSLSQGSVYMMSHSSKRFLCLQVSTTIVRRSLPH